MYCGMKGWTTSKAPRTIFFGTGGADKQAKKKRFSPLSGGATPELTSNKKKGPHLKAGGCMGPHIKITAFSGQVLKLLRRDGRLRRAWM